MGKIYDDNNSNFCDLDILDKHFICNADRQTDAVSLVWALRVPVTVLIDLLFVLFPALCPCLPAAFTCIIPIDPFVI